MCISKDINSFTLLSPLYSMIDTFADMNPSYELLVWTDADAAGLSMFNRAQFDATKNFGLKSDLMRYELLHQFGGFYVDVDYECLQPLEEFFGRCRSSLTGKRCSFVCGVSHTPLGDREVNNGFIG
jgi:hypothetical protein